MGPLQALAMLLAFLLASVTGGVLLAGVAVPAVTAAGTVSNATTGIFDEGVEDFEIEEPSEMSTMYAGDGSVMTNFYQNQRIVVTSSEISPYIKDATVAIEDRRFYDHIGVDVEGLARALVLNFFTNTSQGASTLTQQYIKNAKVEESVVKDDPSIAAEATEQTYGRKLEEARLAIALEKKMSKDEILTGYLNLAQYGKSVWGVEAAARRYFSVPAADVTLSQAATLAAIPQAPGKWDPTIDPAVTQTRRDKVLNDMLEEGMITQAEHDEAIAIPVADLLDVQTTKQGCAGTGNMAYACDYAVYEILSNPVFGETQQDRANLLNRGGLQIYITIDPERQQYAYDAVTGVVPVGDSSNINVALSSVEPGTGRIQAMAQNTEYGKPEIPDDPDELPDVYTTELNLNVGKSHGGGNGFQTGSSFKAITLTQWLKDGHTLGDIVVGNRNKYTPDMWTASCIDGPPTGDVYTPTNLDGVGGARVSVLNATRQSINLPFVEMTSQLDLCDIADTAASMGLTQGNGEPLAIVPSMTLGSNDITPLQMANAFATFATNGTYCTPIMIDRIVTTRGEEIEVPKTECSEVLDYEVAAGVTYALQEVNKSGGTGSGAAIPGRPTAGKTGTANNNWYAWYVGFTPQLSSAVMMGHKDSNTSMNNKTINGRWQNRVYGGLLAAPAWRAYTEPALAGVDPVGFPNPKQKRTIEGDLVAAPSVIGMSVQDAQSYLESRSFTLRVEETQVFSDRIPAGAIASQNPGGGSRITVGSVISVQVSKGPEPKPDPTDEPEDDDDDGGRGGDRGGNDD